MSDDAPGVVTPTVGGPDTQPGSDASPQASNGGDQTPVSSATGERWDDPNFRREKLDILFHKGYREGRDKGRRDAEADLLSSFSVDSVDELKARLEAKKPEEKKPRADQQDPQQDDAGTRLLRQMKEERVLLEKKVGSLEAENKRLSNLMSRAMKSEVSGKLSSMGAHPEGLEDLTEVAMRSLRWDESGTDIEVIARGDDGSVEPTRYTFIEYLTQLKDQKPFFFAPPPRSGSGSAPPVQNPAAAEPPKSFNTLRERLNAYEKRKQR